MAYESKPVNKQPKPVTKQYGKKTVSLDKAMEWWKSSDDEMYNNIISLIHELDTKQALRSRLNTRNFKLYQSYQARGFTTGLQNSFIGDSRGTRITMNVVKSIIDTCASRLAQARPRPEFITEDGDYKLQRKAKNLTKFLDGIFDELNVYQIGQQAAIDAEVFGTGIVKVFENSEKLCIERVIPFELIIDEVESLYGFPRQMHQRRMVNRDVLINLFPESAEDIRTVVSTDEVGSHNSPYNSNTVLVVESWHLPSGDEATDGKHAICIRNKTLWVEPFTKDHFPFVFIRWTDALAGFWGTAICDEVVGIQIEINKLLQLIQQAQELISNPRILVDAQAVIAITHLNDQIGAIVKYTGQKPEFITPTAINPEIYQYLENLIDKAYNIAGVSQLSAQQEKPVGIEAGVALRTLQDIESQRFQLFGQRYERFYLDIAKRFIEAARDLEEQDTTLSIKAKGKNTIQTLNWKDVNLDDDKYSMRLFPTNLLPTTPAGKLQTAQELLQAGLITQEEGKSLLDFPDLEYIMGIENAAIDNIKWVIEELSDGRYQAPEPFMNLQLAIQMVQSAYLKAKSNGYPDKILELYRLFLDDTQQLITIATQPPSTGTPPDTGIQGQAVTPGENDAPTAEAGTLPLARTARLPQAPLAPGGGLR